MLSILSLALRVAQDMVTKLNLFMVSRECFRPLVEISDRVFMLLVILRHRQVTRRTRLRVTVGLSGTSIECESKFLSKR